MTDVRLAMQLRRALGGIGRKPRQPVHFLHVGKTAGTAVEFALRPVSAAGPYELRFHPHDVTLPDIPEGQKVVFAVRDPVERYVSGFYSRQRQGRPRYDIPWTREESAAFGCFATANALAEALSATDGETRTAAVDAMRSIRHVRDSYWRWFRDPEYLTSRTPDVLFVLWLDGLARGFGELCDVLGVGTGISLPDDDVAAHRNPPTVDRTVSAIGRANLREWYGADYAFLDLCRSLPGRRRAEPDLGEARA